LVVGKKHDHGGYDSITDAEIPAVLADIRQRANLFFT
jgi:hypothetical protein